MTDFPSYAVVALAAGKSSRCDAGKASRDVVGLERKKPFFPLLGVPTWLWSVRKFAARRDVAKILLVVAREDFDEARKKYARELDEFNVKLVVGGAERFLSVENALKETPEDVGFIAVHDAARPCASVADVDRVFAEAARSGAAILATPVVGSLKRSEERSGRAIVRCSVPRDALWEAGTPQVFRRDLLVRAYRERARDVLPTDDCGLVEALGVETTIVRGSRLNLKITSEEDLELAELILRMETQRD